MQETDLVTITLTVCQARYLGRKLHKIARAKFSDARMYKRQNDQEKFDYHFRGGMVCEALSKECRAAINLPTDETLGCIVL